MEDSRRYGPLPITREEALLEIADLERRISSLEQDLIEDDGNDGDAEGGASSTAAAEEPALAEDGRRAGATVQDVANEVHDWLPPLKCVPICADVRTFDFKVPWACVRCRLHLRSFVVIFQHVLCRSSRCWYQGRRAARVSQ